MKKLLIGLTLLTSISSVAYAKSIESASKKNSDREELSLWSYKEKAFSLGKTGKNGNTSVFLVVNKDIDVCYRLEVRKFEAYSSTDREMLSIPCEKLKKYKEIREYYKE